MLLRSIARALNICLPEVNTYYTDSENVACAVDLVQLVAERATATDGSLNVDPRVEYDDAVQSWDWTWDAISQVPTYVPPHSISPIDDGPAAGGPYTMWADEEERKRALIEPAFQYRITESTDTATRILEPLKLPSTAFFPRTDYSQGDPDFVDQSTPPKGQGRKKHHSSSRSRNARKHLDSKGYQELRPAFDSLKVESLNLSSTNWSGRALPYLVGDAIIAAWQSFALGPVLSMFLRLPFTDIDQRPIKIFDVKGRLIIYRSNLVHLFAPSPSAGVSAGLNALALGECASSFMRDFVNAADHFVVSATKYVGENVRGSHWFMIAGHDRQNKEMPALTAWHRQNIKPLQELFTRGGIFDRTSGLANGMLVHFPGIKARYEQMANYMALVYGISPLYGLFWNFCLNHGGSRRLVDCRPHVDKANIAIGVCVIFIYGWFNHWETCWLVVWEAGLIIQLPPGVFLVYPSSLFYHFNTHISDIEIVVTRDGEYPSKENAEPLNWQKGYCRGSCVWFNQATMFQTSELNVATIKKARALNLDTKCDLESLKSRGLYF